MVSSELGFSSPNFDFLKRHDPLLVRYAAQAERYVFDDPNTALFKLRQFAELLAQRTAAEAGIYLDDEETQVSLLNRLFESRVTPADVSQLFHGIRKSGNEAAHQHGDDRRRALHQLKMARQLGVWFQKTFGNDPHFKAGSFLPPPDPRRAEQALHEELEALRQLLVEERGRAKHAEQTAAEESKLRQLAESEAANVYGELEAALALASETEERLAGQVEEFKVQLKQRQEQVAAAPAAIRDKIVEAAAVAADSMDLDEAATRKIIDEQLHEAGWAADTQSLTYQKGVRPQKGKNLAIAEWPTDKGPADYVLFAGLTPLAVVEAKRQSKDVPGSIEQAKRYSRGYHLTGEQLSPGGPWDEYKVPFLFATNGRPYLKQIRTKSGIWFLDGRLPTNHPRAMEGWYTPQGLEDLLKQDVAAATERLSEEPSDYLPLRDYQHEAVRAVEETIADGRQELLIAMATGTGKTRTCIGIIYRLLKAQRFRRVLFLVDRTSLGEQATNAFKDVKLENYQSLTDIYDVKELSDIVPDRDTRVHVATIQGMVRRLLFNEGDARPIPVDQYDLIVVDECHRGYNLDQEMTDAELTFRSEAEYISKYTRVLEHFDAVKIGLTATPALHTTEIFGGPDQKPIFQYSYRQAVIDGWLIDHEPPHSIVTKLAEEGIKWKVGEEVKIYDTGTDQLQLFTTPDDVEIEVEGFNRQVVTENFNKVVCAELARHIDPNLPGKTLVFCATDAHADLVVDLLKQAFEDQYGPIHDNAVVKITGKADKPLEKIRRLKNESLPNVAVTVDLLTTGIDVPEITNLVFIRRVRSRILYEQMLGRATRLCADLHGPGQDKEVFHIYDAVALYSALEPYTAMKPVVAQPNITFEQLVRELAEVTDESIRANIKDQIIAKLQTKKRTVKGKRLEEFETLTGMDPSRLIRQLHESTPQEAADWFQAHVDVTGWLDEVRQSSGSRVLVSDHDDELRRVERGYGKGTKPDDYLESFRAFVQANQDSIAALKIVCQRPRDLTRQQLRELKLELDLQGYSESHLRTAVRETTNQDIAATIIGYIRHVALGAPLVSYHERVAKAMQAILASRSWTEPQRKWLERIGKQLEQETIVDSEAFEHGQFKAYGGFTRLNKVFDGKLEQILGEISDALWQVAA